MYNKRSAYHYFETRLISTSTLISSTNKLQDRTSMAKRAQNERQKRPAKKVKIGESQASASSSAQDKALTMPKIIENVMAKLPPKDIQQARRASTLWEYQYQHSEYVRVATVAQPKSFVFGKFKIDEGDLAQVPFHPVPVYSKHHRLMVHPSLKYVQSLFDADRKWEMTVLHSDATNEALRDLQEADSSGTQAGNYATSPRCLTLCVHLSTTFFDSLGRTRRVWKTYYTVYVPSGVRMYHVRKAAARMWQSRKEVGDDDWSFFVTLAREVDSD